MSQMGRRCRGSRCCHFDKNWVWIWHQRCIDVYGTWYLIVTLCLQIKMPYIPLVDLGLWVELLMSYHVCYFTWSWKKYTYISLIHLDSSACNAFFNRYYLKYWQLVRSYRHWYLPTCVLHRSLYFTISNDISEVARYHAEAQCDVGSSFE